MVIFQNLVKTWWFFKKSPGFHQVLGNHQVLENLFENGDFQKPGENLFFF